MSELTKVDFIEPAFPLPNERDADGNGLVQGHPGMTLRDYFAAQAMAGWLASYGPEGAWPEKHLASMAKDAYDMADAMLAARKVQL